MYPILLDIRNKNILIVGGGRIALRKARGIIESGGHPRVVSPHFHEDFHHLQPVTLVTKAYSSEDLEGADLILACTDQEKVNHQIVQDAKSHQWVNNCGDHREGDFYNMAVERQEDYLIAVSTYGKNPRQSRQLRQEISKAIDPQL